MNSIIIFSILAFVMLGPHSDASSKKKRGVGNLISKLRNNPEKVKPKDDYDPKAHLYALFLNSSFVNATLPNNTEDISPVFQQPEIIHGKGILDMFKPTTTIDPKDQRFMMYLKSLNNNMTLSYKAGSNSVTQASEEQIMEMTRTIKPHIDKVQHHLMSENNEENGYITTLKENVNEQEAEITWIPRFSNNVETDTTQKKEETTSVGCNKENKVSPKCEREFVTEENKEVVREEDAEDGWYPNDIKYLFPDQL